MAHLSWPGVVLTWREPASTCWHALAYPLCADMSLAIPEWSPWSCWVEPLILLDGVPGPADGIPWSCWMESLILLDGIPGLSLDEVIGTVIVRDTTRSPTVLQWYHLQSTLNSIFVFQKWIETLSLITRYNSANTICTSRPPWQVLYKLTTPSL